MQSVTLKILFSDHIKSYHIITEYHDKVLPKLGPKVCDGAGAYPKLGVHLLPLDEDASPSQGYRIVLISPLLIYSEFRM